MARTRNRDALRTTTIEPAPSAASGSVIIAQGNTRVLCTASISTDLPRWMIDPETKQATQGWVTAEYNMLPGSTPQRKRRGTDSRGTEIQRLIGRSLRAGIDLKKMPNVLLTCDCDVLVADGGTRTASITGSYVALAHALGRARSEGLIEQDPTRGPVAAVSVGIVDGQAYLDLDYEQDVRAEVDLNVAMDHRGQFVEVQGTAEHGAFSRKDLDRLLDLASKGIRHLRRIQRSAMR